MPTVICYVAEVNLYHSLPTLSDPLSIAGQSIADHFKQGSALNTGGAAIDLRFDWSRKDIIPASPDYGVCDGNLQDALARLLKPGAPNDAIPVGLILANFHKKVSSAYGYMFDLNFRTSEFGPRQGCALFLKQISNAAGADIQAFRDRVVFTAIHEIGHLFNLWHVGKPNSFMQPPPNRDLLGSCNFVPEHKEYLKCAANPVEAPFVLPGRSAADFGSRVPGRGYPIGGDSYSSASTYRNISIKIRLSHEKLLHFEPQELEIEISVSGSKAARMAIPEEVDPGYSRFEIWITRPDGERRRYLPLRRFCSNPKTIEITRQNPFRRDISLFRQAGGYTFPIVGRYQVQVLFRLSSEDIVLSNIAECEVLMAQVGTAGYAALQNSLSSTEAEMLFCYRGRLPDRNVFLKLKEFAEDNPALPSAVAVHYSLGSVLLKAASATTDIEWSSALRSSGLDHLRRVQDHALLGVHRRNIVNKLLLGDAGSMAD